MNPARSLETFNSVLAQSGFEAALAFLNGGVPHRYTAVYRLEGGTLRNLALHDKKGELRPEFLAAVPLEASFCQFALRDGSFRTEDSANDARLDAHPYQGVLVSYHGVPLMSDSGDLWGTLCHFDVDALPLSDEEFALLQEAGRILAGQLRPEA